MPNYDDFDLDLKNTTLEPKVGKVIKTLYSKLSCPTQPWAVCFVEITTVLPTPSGEYSCGCPGASVTDTQCNCPPKDYGTLEVCINSINK